MKIHKIFPVVLALAVIGFTLWYFVGKKNTINDHSHPHDNSEIISSELDTLNELDDNADLLELTRFEYPEVSSFSTAGSNRKVAEDQELRLRKAAARKTVSTSQKEPKPFANDFILGFYYFGNLTDEDLAECSLKNANKNKNRFSPEYTPENFRLQDLEFRDDAVYISVDADEFPEDVCAHIGIYKNIQSPYQAIHVVVE